MNDSLKYGIPFAFVLFGSYILQVVYFYETASMLRQTIVAAVAWWLVLYSIKANNQAFFPFKVAFLSAFNVLFVTVMGHGLLIYLAGEHLLGEAPAGVGQNPWILYHVFNECMGFMFVSVLLSALFSYLLRTKSK